MKSYKKHTMYNKAGKGFTANTHEQHLSMKKKGYSHSKPSSTEKKVGKIIKKKSGY
tara:strand:+ start:1676 stop:1843 length:168 start_codon:yes stop_codon:yes gene_type:complete